jgi:D-alanyl-D-alanine carboxypeptidase
MMDHRRDGALSRLRWRCLSLAAIVALVATTAETADARSKRKRPQVKRQHHAAIYRPPYADIVVDAKTGAVLHQADADRIRHPASLTKIMTLYLLFEQLDAGALRLDTRLDVSHDASIQAPTKLGLKPGQSITVEDAIKALVTKSANDAAVVLAEALAGSEEEFARKMTRKARALGMSRTVYRNASGLPNDEQVTTARDQALLGVAIQQRFPKYYKYFSTRHFVFRGTPMRNHNQLLGRIEGVDGIKTGYIRASGFNLVTSVRRDGRHIVAVVLGGRSSDQRDGRMRSLIDSYIRLASTKPATNVAEVAIPKPAPLPPPVSGSQLAAAANAPMSFTPLLAGEATAAIPDARPGSSAPIKPVPVKIVAVRLVPQKQATENVPALAASTAAPMAVEPALSQAPAKADNTAPPSPPKGTRVGILSALPAMVATAGETAAPAAAEQVRAPARPPRRGGWAIQVGAFEDEADAKQRLDSAQSAAAKLLDKADAYTERTKRGDKTFYRARFVGFDRKQAQAACKRLKRSDIDCMALKF